MATAPSNTVWGSIYDSKAKLGIAVSLSSSTTTTVTLKIDVYLALKWNINDSSNSYSFTYTNDSGTSVTDPSGTSLSLKFGTTSGSGWTDTSCSCIASYTKTYTKWSSARTVYFSASLSGLGSASYGVSVSNVSYSIPAVVTYTISYNANGGSGAPSSHSYVYAPGGTTYLSSTIPTRSGYTFLGWSLSSTATSASYSAGQAWSTGNASNYTLYAVWSSNAITNSIHHWAWGFQNGEGHNSDGSAFRIAQTTFTASVGSSYALNANYATTIPTGYHISPYFGTSYISGSWSSYAFNTSVTQTSSAGYFEFGYYPDTYTISYNMNGGTNNSSNPTSYNILYGVSIADPEPLEHHIFKGWDKEIINATHLGGASDGSVTFTNDVSGNTLSASKVQIWTSDWSSSNCILYTSVNTTGVVSATYVHDKSTGRYIIQFAANGSTKDYSAYATVRLELGKTYTVTYNQSSASSSQIVISDISFIEKNATGINAGCNASFSSVQDLYDKLNLRHTGNVTFIANYEPITYTVTYHNNGGTGAPASQTKMEGTALTLSSDKPTRTRHTFLGWSPSKTATGVTYSSGVSYSDEADIILYAVWRCDDDSIYIYPTGVIEALHYTEVDTVITPFDSGGNVYATEFIEVDEATFYITSDGKMYAKEFVEI